MNNIVRGPLSVNFDITNRCNLSCLHCYNNSGEGDFTNELSDNEVLSIIDQIIEVKPFSVCICGGETLIRKDLVLKVVKKLSDAGINCGMVTNGMYLNDNFTAALKANGINNVQISLDGNKISHNKLRNNGKAYDGAVRGLRLLKKHKIITGIAFSPTKWNISELEDVYSLADEMDLYEVRLQDLMPIGRAEKNSYILPTEEDYRKLKRIYNQKKLAYLNGETNVNTEWGDPIDHMIVFTNNHNDKSYTDSICILSDGSITPSIYLPGIFGNLREHTLSEYWDSGLNKIWGSEFIKRMVSELMSVSSLSMPSNNTQNTDPVKVSILD